MPPDEFGAWGQWVGAVATVAAVVVALWVALRDSRRRDRELADQRAAQARTVTATIAVVSDEPGKDFHEASRHRTAVVVENHGVLPVTDVVFHMFEADGGSLTVTPAWPEVPGVERHDDPGFALCPVLPPGGRFESLAVDGYLDDVGGPGEDPQDVMVNFSFVDAEGLRWRRIGDGRPQRMLADRDS